MLLLASLPLGLALLQAVPSAPAPDALALLNEVSQHYANAKSYHIEAVEERTTTGELSRDWHKTFMTAIVMPGGRHRYEGRNLVGTAVLISDGTHQWDYLPERKAYTQGPALSEEAEKKRMHPQEELASINAESIAVLLGHLAEGLKSAETLPDEQISIGGKTVDCFVVHFSDDKDDYKVRKPSLSRETTLWIDKSRRVIVKKLERSQPLSSVPVNGHVLMTTEVSVIYPVVELDQQEPESSFTFVAPADAQQVEAFSSPLTVGPQFELVGRSAADLHLKSADGKITTLSSFRGKPVFLDFWATWCGPCKGMVPDLVKLYTETSAKGLVWVGIDSDENPDAADKFISREHIPWANYHDLDGSFGVAFHRNAIPLGVLIDAHGTITFYETAYEVKDLRNAIARLGTEFASAVGGVATK